MKQLLFILFILIFSTISTETNEEIQERNIEIENDIVEIKELEENDDKIDEKQIIQNETNSWRSFLHNIRKEYKRNGKVTVDMNQFKQMFYFFYRFPRENVSQCLLTYFNITNDNSSNNCFKHIEKELNLIYVYNALVKKHYEKREEMKEDIKWKESLFYPLRFIYDFCEYNNVFKILKFLQIPKKSFQDIMYQNEINEENRNQINISDEKVEKYLNHTTEHIHYLLKFMSGKDYEQFEKNHEIMTEWFDHEVISKEELNEIYNKWDEKFFYLFKICFFDYFSEKNKVIEYLRNTLIPEMREDEELFRDVANNRITLVKELQEKVVGRSRNVIKAVWKEYFKYNHKDMELDEINNVFSYWENVSYNENNEKHDSDDFIPFTELYNKQFIPRTLPKIYNKIFIIIEYFIMLFIFLLLLICFTRICCL